MKTLILILFTLPCLTFAQNQNSVYPKLPYSDFSFIAVDGSNIFLAGTCDIGSVSKNGGNTYENFELDESVIDIKIVPNSNGEKAYYLTRDLLFEVDVNNPGLSPVTDANLSFLTGSFRSFEIIGEVVYLIASSTIYYSQIGNDNWEQLCEITYENDDYTITSDATENNIYVGSRNGTIQKVSLSDGTITPLKQYNDRISGIAMATDEIGYADVSGISGVERTRNGWATTDNISTLEGIGVITYGENIVISVNTNRLYVSMDQGETSTYIKTPEDGTVDLISDSYVHHDGTIYFAGRSSMVLKTENFGASFQNLNAYKRVRLGSIDVRESGFGLAGGGNGTLISTNDGGENWEELDLGISSESYINDLIILNNDRALVAHDEGLAIIENGVIINSQTNQFERLLYNSEKNYIIGMQNQAGEYIIQKSTDNGETWSSKGRLTDYSYNISQSPTGRIFIPSGDEIVYISDDDGETWSTEDYGISNVRQVVFLNETHGLITDYNNIYKTTDGGATSTNIASGYNLQNIYYFNEDKIMYTGATNNKTTIRESEDGGASFKTTGSYCAVTLGSDFDGDQTVWLAQTGGHINKHQVDLQPNATNQESILETEVFPNPIKLGQDLQINLQETAYYTVTLFNSSGQKVIEKTTNQNQISLPITDVHAGLHFVQIKSNHGAVITNKLLIIE